MSNLLKKVSYLKGFCEGLGINGESNEGKVINKLIEVIEEMADELERMAAVAEDHELLIDNLSDDMLMLLDDDDDDDLYDDDDEDFEDFEDFDDDDDGTSDFFEIQCPECGEDFMIDYDEILDGDGLRCPHCDKRIELKIDEEDEDNEDISF